MSNFKNLCADFSVNDVEILDNTCCYSGFLQVEKYLLRHRLFAGGWSGEIQREVVQKEPGVGVLLYDPDLDKVLMVEQFRVGCLDDEKGPWKLELVAGLVEEGETPEKVAVREALEEANTKISRLLPVAGYFNSPGSSSEKLSVFCARVDAKVEEGFYGLHTENEDIRTVIISRSDALKAISDGIIDNAMSIIALQWLTLNLASVRKALNGAEQQ